LTPLAVSPLQTQQRAASVRRELGTITAATSAVADARQKTHERSVHRGQLWEAAMDARANVEMAIAQLKKEEEAEGKRAKAAGKATKNKGKNGKKEAKKDKGCGDDASVGSAASKVSNDSRGSKDSKLSEVSGEVAPEDAGVAAGKDADTPLGRANQALVEAEAAARAAEKLFLRANDPMEHAMDAAAVADALVALATAVASENVYLLPSAKIDVALTTDAAQTTPVDPDGLLEVSVKDNCNGSGKDNQEVRESDNGSKGEGDGEGDIDEMDAAALAAEAEAAAAAAAEAAGVVVPFRGFRPSGGWRSWVSFGRGCGGGGGPWPGGVAGDLAGDVPSAWGNEDELRAKFR